MKKLVSLGFLVLFLTAVAGAQQTIRYRHQPNEITRFERAQFRKDATRYRSAERHARRDGRISPRERARLHKMKARTRCDAHRYRHNGRKRII